MTTQPAGDVTPSGQQPVLECAKPYCQQTAVVAVHSIRMSYILFRSGRWLAAA